MSGKRFRARAKTVQKLGRDGLVEQNMSTGEEKRISQRTADISFGPDRSVEQVAGHRAAQRSGDDPASPAKKRRKQPRPVQQTAEEAVYAAQAPASVPEVPVPDAPSMRMAADAPMMAPAVTSEDTPPPPPAPRKRRKRNNRKKSKRRQVAKHTPDAAHSLKDQSMRGAGDAPMQNQPPGFTPAKRPLHLAESGGRLKFDVAGGEKPVSDGTKSADARTKMKEQQARRFTPDAAQPAATVEQRPSRLMDEGGGRLKFDAADGEKPVSGGAKSPDARTKMKKRQVRRFAPDAAQPAATVEQHPSRLMDEGGRRLKFDAADGEKPGSEGAKSPDAKAKMKKQQVRRFVPDAAQPAATVEQPPSHLMDDCGGRLRFEGAAEDAAPDPAVDPSAEEKRAVKERQVMDHAADAAQPENGQRVEPPAPAEDKADTRQRDSPQPEPKAPELAAVPADRAEYAPISSERRRLQFEDTPPKVDHAASPSPPAPKEDAPPSSRKYEKAVRRVERAGERVERARADLPTKRRLSIQPEPDSETGRPRRRLHFEQEVLPEYRPPSLPARAGGMAKTAAVMKLHGKVHESERQNVAVEATHKSELFAEQGVERALRWNKNHRRSKPYRALRQAEQRAAKENINLAWQTALRDNPELRNKNVLAKWMQKQKIKRKYAHAAHEAKQTAQFTQNVVQATGQIVRAVQQYLAAKKSLLAAVALLAMVVVFFSAGMTSCTAMLSGFQSSYISASYMANEQDICNADLYYTELETDLQMDINDTETNYPGYDEYRYNIGEISHNPYELMGYLSTMFNAFTFDQVKAEIVRLFGEQYQLTRTETTEDGKTILQTTLTVTPLSTVISNSLPPGEQTDRYNVYQQTLGNRQAYGNPFDFPWLGYVTSGYGYRVHPISGEKNLHRGVDIAVAQGTPIKAIHDGRVVSAGDAGGYGLCVVIEDEKGYQSRYAHCSSISVSVGQEVKRGDVIAAVGSTGNSTGPHLHLEIMLNGEYLNPYYFVDTGYDGTTSGAIPGAPGGAVIPDYPGEPPTNETFAAMLEEAEKYLGYPYVWGGSSPSTSFDCSGFVSWVINHSGWDVGRLGAQGLYNICTPVSIENAQPGDLIFFWHTYDAPNPNGVTHVGIYVGNGQMIHCGNPISYANINSNYWQSHFYGYARLP